MPERPASVSPLASFNAKDDEWELGERRGELCVGDWIWWRPDGTVVGTTHFDDAGRPHGMCRRFHPNGELALEAPYHRGVAHGKQIMTRPSKGESPENAAVAQLPGVYRMETLNVAGTSQGIATFYGVAGLEAPVAANAEGRSIDLGAHLDKLLHGTELVMVAPFLHTMMGKIPTSMVGRIRYICLAMVNSTMHRLEVVDDQGQSGITIADAAEISRALSLAVDYRAARLTPPTS